MSTTATITIHEIATDGLPDMNNKDLLGRVAFIFDGSIVSGWPLVPEYMDREGLTVTADERDSATRGDTLWQGDTDVAHGRPSSGITHWVEFPQPIWDIVKPDPA